MVFAFVVGLLSAVFLGIAMSTFLFVAAFFRSGVVKFVANGITLRSTIERPVRVAKWLDQNGDLIQILVLQTYLFFGNASSAQHYIASMFEDPVDDLDILFLPPIPRMIILDLTLVTGMDTSAVDIFAEILSLVSKHNCKLFLVGLSTDLRRSMQLAGVKPDLTIRDRSKQCLRFFRDLDSAIGKAEDMLLNDEAFEEDFHVNGPAQRGFRHALQHIDEQVRIIARGFIHGIDTALTSLFTARNIVSGRPCTLRGVLVDCKS